MERLPDSVQKLWRIGGIITAGALGLIPALAISGLIVATETRLVVLALPVILWLGIVALGFWWAGVKFQNWRWAIDERWVEARHGVVGHHRVVIPRNRIQTVTTNSGPIDRMLDLETITVHTAGGGAPNLTIPHLTTSTVARIRAELGQGVDR